MDLSPINLRRFEVLALAARARAVLVRPLRVPSHIGPHHTLAHYRQDNGLGGYWIWEGADRRMASATFQGPFGWAGDRTWVREMHFVERPDFILYRATDLHAPVARWTPAAKMPRWASRFTLEVEEVRALRVQTLAPDDVRQTGVEEYWSKLSYEEARAFGDRWTDAARRHGYEKHAPDWRGAYAVLWDRDLAVRDAHQFAENPWVWQARVRVVAADAPAREGAAA